MTYNQLRLLLLDQLLHSTPHFHYQKRRQLVLKALTTRPAELSVLRLATTRSVVRVLPARKRKNAPRQLTLFPSTR